MLELEAFICSIRLAGVTTFVLLFVGGGIAYFLAFSRLNLRFLVESFVVLPLALPPTVVGFYLLVLFGRENALGAWLQDNLNIQVLFSFWGLVVGSVVYSLPFMVRPLQAGFEAVLQEYREMAVLCGASVWQAFWRVVIPLSWRSIVAGCILTFAHALGEFGIVMMIGGNIPAETRTASIALYDAVQAADYATAHRFALTLLCLCFFLNVFVILLNRFLWKPDTV